MKTKHRFIENGPAVIDIATRSYANPFKPKSRIIVKARAVAKVNASTGDQYSSEVGKKLASLRAEVKLAEKYNKIMAGYKTYFLNQITPIVNESQEDLENANNELNEYLKTI